MVFMLKLTVHNALSILGLTAPEAMYAPAASEEEGSIE
jgi:hypothetical protein